MLQRAAVVVFLFALAVNLIRVFAMKDDVGDYDEMIIVLPIYCIVSVPHNLPHKPGCSRWSFPLIIHCNMLQVPISPT